MAKGLGYQEKKIERGQNDQHVRAQNPTSSRDCAGMLKETKNGQN